MYLSICSIVSTIAFPALSHKLIDCILKSTKTATTTTKNYHNVFHLFVLLNITIQCNMENAFIDWLIHSPFLYLSSSLKNTNRICCFQWQLKLSLQMFILLFSCYSVKYTINFIIVQFMNFIPCQWSANEFCCYYCCYIKIEWYECMHVKLCNFKTTNVILNYDNWKIASILMHISEQNTFRTQFKKHSSQLKRCCLEPFVYVYIARIEHILNGLTHFGMTNYYYYWTRNKSNLNAWNGECW